MPEGTATRKTRPTSSAPTDTHELQYTADDPRAQAAANGAPHPGDRHYQLPFADLANQLLQQLDAARLPKKAPARAAVTCLLYAVQLPFPIFADLVRHALEQLAAAAVPDTEDYRLAVQQLAQALVDLEREAPSVTVYPRPKPDNTILTLWDWAVSLDLPLDQSAMLKAICRFVDWKTGSGCTASVETLRHESGIPTKQRATAARTALMAKGIVGRKRRLSLTAQTWLILDPHDEPKADRDSESATSPRSESATSPRSESATSRQQSNHVTNHVNQEREEEDISSLSFSLDSPPEQYDADFVDFVFEHHPNWRKDWTHGTSAAKSWAAKNWSGFVQQLEERQKKTASAAPRFVQSTNAPLDPTWPLSFAEIRPILAGCTGCEPGKPRCPKHEWVNQPGARERRDALAAGAPPLETEDLDTPATASPPALEDDPAVLDTGDGDALAEQQEGADEEPAEPDADTHADGAQLLEDAPAVLATEELDTPATARAPAASAEPAAAVPPAPPVLAVPPCPKCGLPACTEDAYAAYLDKQRRIPNLPARTDWTCEPCRKGQIAALPPEALR